MRRCLATLMLVVSLAPLAGAAEPAYVATWGSDVAQCAVPQEREGAPMIVSAEGFDQYEAHCKFESVEGSHPEWKISAACSVQGDTQDAKFTLTVNGDTLTMADDYGSSDYVRCP